MADKKISQMAAITAQDVPDTAIIPLVLLTGNVDDRNKYIEVAELRKLANPAKLVVRLSQSLSNAPAISSTIRNNLTNPIIRVRNGAGQYLLTSAGGFVNASSFYQRDTNGNAIIGYPVDDDSYVIETRDGVSDGNIDGLLDNTLVEIRDLNL